MVDMRRRSLLTVGTLLLAHRILPGKTVPNRYIVQFADDPKTLADVQKSVREYIEKHQGRILTTMDTVMKAFAVEMDAKTAEKVRKMPGVSAVKPDRVISPANPR
jgi:Peptidase inhibitor I9